MHIVYIHGLNSSHTSFSYIKDKLPEHTAHLIDYASHQRLSESLEQVMKKIPKTEKFAIVGHSLGGVIAALVASARPDQVEALVTISSPLNGSRAASTLRWIPGALPVLNDIVPRSSYIKEVGALQLEVPTLSIVSTGGHLPTSPEANDSVVAVSSQRGLKFGKKVEIKATHFEVLMHDKTVKLISDFLFGDSK